MKAENMEPLLLGIALLILLWLGLSLAWRVGHHLGRIDGLERRIEWLEKEAKAKP